MLLNFFARNKLVFVHSKLFRPSLMFVGKARSLAPVEHLKGTSLRTAPVLPIGLGWKGLPGTYTLSYYENQ